MLTNDLAEAIEDGAAAIVPVAVCGLRRKLVRLASGCRRVGKGADLLGGTERDSICLPQCAVHRTSFCHPHFGAVDQRTDIRGVSITVSDKSLTSWGLVDGGSAGPARSTGSARSHAGQGVCHRILWRKPCAKPPASRSRLSSPAWPNGPRKTAMPCSASSTAISVRKQL